MLKPVNSSSRSAAAAPKTIAFLLSISIATTARQAQTQLEEDVKASIHSYKERSSILKDAVRFMNHEGPCTIDK